MPLPDPKPGLVIRYDYVWTREAAQGREHSKDRPACLVAASNTTPPFVVILPITHNAPTGNASGIEIPPRVRAHLGLDDEPCWVIVSEHNVDEWPNAGLASLPQRPDAFSYGFLPPRLFIAIKEAFLDLYKSQSGVRRIDK